VRPAIPQLWDANPVQAVSQESDRLYNGSLVLLPHGEEDEQQYDGDHAAKHGKDNPALIPAVELFNFFVKKGGWADFEVRANSVQLRFLFEREASEPPHKLEQQILMKRTQRSDNDLSTQHPPNSNAPWLSTDCRRAGVNALRRLLVHAVQYKLH
jgi:hypothetical protein